MAPSRDMAARSQCRSNANHNSASCVDWSSKLPQNLHSKRDPSKCLNFALSSAGASPMFTASKRSLIFLSPKKVTRSRNKPSNLGQASEVLSASCRRAAL